MSRGIRASAIARFICSTGVSSRSLRRSAWRSSAALNTSFDAACGLGGKRIQGSLVHWPGWRLGSKDKGRWVLIIGRKREQKNGSKDPPLQKLETFSGRRLG